MGFKNFIQIGGNSNMLSWRTNIILSICFSFAELLAIITALHTAQCSVLPETSLCTSPCWSPGSGMRTPGCSLQHSSLSWSRHHWAACSVTMVTTSSKSRLMSSWRHGTRRITWAAVRYRRSICECGKTAVKVSEDTIALSGSAWVRVCVISNSFNKGAWRKTHESRSSSF